MPGVTTTPHSSQPLSPVNSGLGCQASVPQPRSLVNLCTRPNQLAHHHIINVHPAVEHYLGAAKTAALQDTQSRRSYSTPLGPSNNKIIAVLMYVPVLARVARMHEVLVAMSRDKSTYHSLSERRPVETLLQDRHKQLKCHAFFVAGNVGQEL